MSDTLEQLRNRIAALYSQREQLKSALENHSVPVRQGLKQLLQIDAQLSLLDTRFKQLWDARQEKQP